MSALAPDAANADQVAYWNGAAGRKWRDRQQLQDAVFAPVIEALMAAAAPAPGERVIDIGCGAGATTLAAAAQSGHALGVDVSELLVERARERAAELKSPARFELADATVRDFSQEHADLMISRFGVMFFADPAKSFTNMRIALKPGSRLVFACWREPKTNPWMMVPLRAATQHAPAPPKLDPDDPGPFSFAAEERVRRILDQAGFSGVTMEPHDLPLDIAAGRGIDVALESALEIGPTSRALADQPEDVRRAATQEIRGALEGHRVGESVTLGAGIWIVRATA